MFFKNLISKKKHTLETINKVSEVLTSNPIILLVLILITILSIVDTIVNPYFFISDAPVLFPVITGEKLLPTYPMGAGRFFPFAVTEYIPILRSGLSYATIENYLFYFAALKFAICIFVIFYLFRLYSESWKTAFIFYAVFVWFATPSEFYRIYTDLVYPETFMLFVLSCVFVLFFFAKKYDSMALYILSLICSNYCLYLKEPVFSMFVVFSFAHLFFLKNTLTFKEKIYHYALIVSSGLFLFLYFKLADLTGQSYATGRVGGDYYDLIKRIIIDYKIYIPILIACVRTVSILFFKKKVILADIFILMALTYATSYAVLFLNALYYFYPTFLLLCLACSLYAEVIYKKYSAHFDFSKSTFVYLIMFIYSCEFLYKAADKYADRYNLAKVATHEIIELHNKLLKNDTKILFTSLKEEEYDAPYHYIHDNWSPAGASIYLNFFYNKGLIRLDYDEFALHINAGHVGYISIVFPELKKQLQKDYPNFLFFGTQLGTELVVDKKYIYSSPFAEEYHTFLTNVIAKFPELIHMLDGVTPYLEKQ